MVLILVVTLLILGIAFYQAVQGCFGAIIMAVLTVLCSAVALNYYEPLGDMLADKMGAYAHPSALLAMFVIPLLALRILFDKFIRGNVVLGMWPDRIGGGVFGLVTAMVLTGMFMIIFQLLPMPASIITYQPYDEMLNEKHGGPPRWAVGFTLGLAKHFSAGPFRPIGDDANQFGLAHDDLRLEAFCQRNRPTGAKASAKTDAIEVDGAYVVELPGDKRLGNFTRAERTHLERGIKKIAESTPRYPRPPLLENEETKILIVRVKVDELARNDKDHWFRLPATQFRLVCKSGRSFYPVGYLTYTGVWQVNTFVSDTDPDLARIGDILVARQWKKEGGPHKLPVDWVYRIPKSEKVRQIIFRRTAKVTGLSVVKGLPGHTGTLAAKPVNKKVSFDPSGGNRQIFSAKYIELDARLPGNMKPCDTKGREFGPLKRIQIANYALEDGLIIGSVDAANKSIPGKAQHVHNMKEPGTAFLLFQVHCKVNRGFGDTGILHRMKPVLVLDKGQPIPHRGAWLFYDYDSKKHVYFYYKASLQKTRLDADFVRAFQTNASRAGSFGLIFAVPISQDRSIVGLRFGVGPTYEFGTSSPLVCGRKLRSGRRRR